MLILRLVNILKRGNVYQKKRESFMPRTQTTAPKTPPTKKNTNAKKSGPITKKDLPKRAAKTAASKKATAAKEKQTRRKNTKKTGSSESGQVLTASDVVGKKFSVGHFGLLVDCGKYPTVISQDGMKIEDHLGSVLGPVVDEKNAITTKKGYLEKYSALGPHGLRFYHVSSDPNEETEGPELDADASTDVMEPDAEMKTNEVSEEEKEGKNEEPEAPEKKSTPPKNKKGKNLGKTKSGPTSTETTDSGAVDETNY